MITLISVIIIVKNDRRIENVLQALESISSPLNMEVLVVDASKGKLNDIKNKFKYIQWITFTSKTTKKITIPEQRNVGVKKSHGDIIAFIDSDCVPQKKWLEELVKPIICSNENIVAGKVILKDAKSIHNIVKDIYPHKKYVDESPTMNIAISRKVFNTISGYDESFNFGSDVDFAWRAIYAGFKILYNPKAIIYHDVGNTKNELRRMYVYGKARTKLYMKNTFRMKYFFGNELLTIIYPLYFIFLPLTYYYHFYPLLIFFPIIRYWKSNPLCIILMKTVYGLGVLKALIIPE